MDPSYKHKPVLFGLLIAAFVFVLDQLSKFYIVNDVMENPHVIEVTSFFNIVMAWNNGVSFGMFNWDSHIKSYVLTAMAFAAALGLLFWMMREKRLSFVIPCGAIIGGAIGNGVDRLHWGAVADFLDFHAMGYHWPAFNVADMGITCGATLLIVDSLFSKSDSSKTEENE
jgi:signal peptidase II